MTPAEKALAELAIALEFHTEWEARSDRARKALDVAWDLIDHSGELRAAARQEVGCADCGDLVELGDDLCADCAGVTTADCYTFPPGVPLSGDALRDAILAFTVEAPDDQPNGPTEAAIELMCAELEDAEEEMGPLPESLTERWSDVLTSMADDVGRLRVAAEAFFGGDFRRPRNNDPGETP